MSSFTPLVVILSYEMRSDRYEMPSESMIPYHNLVFPIREDLETTLTPCNVAWHNKFENLNRLDNSWYYGEGLQF